MKILGVIFKSIATLMLLLLALPFNAAVVLAALLINWVVLLSRESYPVGITANSKTILLTGGKMTKALQLARSFHKAGHRVILVETAKYWLSGHRYSRAVSQFHTVPAPEQDAEGYYRALVDLVHQENIDVFIPVSSPVASYHDAVAGEKMPSDCEVLHFSAEMTLLLDNKFTLCQQALALGLSAPKVHLITNPQQILNFDFAAEKRPYILKSIRYDSVSRLDLSKLPWEGMEDFINNLPITQDNPWVMQEFIAGQEYCTHSTVRDGKIQLHCCAESSPFQVNYAQVDKPEILAWVGTFVSALNLTGQISFDFMQTEDGSVYPIECNPRTHSAITMFYNHSGLAEAYLSAREAESPIQPLLDSKSTYWIYHELWRLTDVRSWSDLRLWAQKILKGKDAIFAVRDPIPFLTVPHWQITLLLLNNLRQLKSWVKIDFNIGKLVEPAGD